MSSAGLETQWIQVRQESLVYFDWLRKCDAVKVATRAKPLGGRPKLIAKGPGEGFVRAVSRVEGDGQNIGRTAGERSGRFRQPTAAHIAHDRPPGRDAEDA
jgi:hypothetical protein